MPARLRKSSGRALTAALLAIASTARSGPEALGPIEANAVDGTRDASRPLNHDTRDTDRFGWLVPDFAKLQTGGYTGLINLGLGYAALNDILNLGLDYGYVPESHAGRTVHTVTASLALRPFDARIGRFRLVPGYLWGGVMFTEGEGYFYTLGDRYPSDYYRPTAVNVLYGVGVEIDWLPSRHSFFERHGVYWEARAFGPFFVTYLENPEQRNLTDVVVSTLGYRAAW